MKINIAGIEIGKSYETKCGNIIQVAAIEEAKEGEPDAQPVYLARMIYTLVGYESMIGTVQKYLSDGKWLNHHGQVVVNCIHDITKEHIE